MGIEKIITERGSIGLMSSPPPTTTKLKQYCNCKNCGAPLKNYGCEYCGTVMVINSSEMVKMSESEVIEKITKKLRT